ncbi:MAG: hypothetical protein M1457_13165 [bacterium]|nr:hypothetical protein [bacterium]
MRYILIVLLIAAALLLSFPLYYRARVDRVLRQATIEIGSDPGRAYVDFDPIFSINNLVTLGRAREAQRRFVAELFGTARRLLSASIPTDQSFIQAQFIYPVLQRIEREHGIPTRAERAGILRLIRDASPALKTQGTLSAWETMVQFMQTVAQMDPAATSRLEGFDGWMAAAMAFDSSPLGIRESLLNSGIYFYQGLQNLGIHTPMDETTTVVQVPGDLSDAQLVSAEKSFSQGLDTVLAARVEQHSEAIPTELSAIRASLLYNLSAIKVAHLQDLGATGPHTISGYIAEYEIRSDQTRVPPSEELYREFVDDTREQLYEARQHFAASRLLSAEKRRAYEALTCWTESLVAAVGGRDATQPKTQAETLSTGLTDDGGAVTATMRQSPRPLLIQRVPDLAQQK